MMYKVIWEIDLEAENPQEAAKLARRLQIDPSNIADHFTVLDGEGNGTEVNACEPG